MTIDLGPLDWQKIVNQLKSYATSELARIELSQISPLPSPQAAQESFVKIFAAQNVISQGQRPFMESLDLFSTWHPRLTKKATLTTLELKDIRHFCIEAIALNEILSANLSEWSNSQKKRLMKAEEALSAIDQIITPEGHIRTDASETLYKLNNEKNQQTQQVQKILDKVVKTHEMEPLLQDRYVTNREGRMVLPIKSGMQHQFEGIIHASSQSKQTVFMEPQEIIPLNNRLRQIEVEIEQEIQRLLTELSQYLSSLEEDFQRTKDTLLECDLFFAKAQLSGQLEASTCEFSANEIYLKDVRHPVLVLNNESVVANTVSLDLRHHVLLLSGPNAGGKTVLLKAIGLAAHMARCGLPICAGAESKLPFFKDFYVAIGDSQSVDAHLSTFAAHLKILDTAAKAKGQDQLLLIDEICGSTDPEEGSALARSFIKTYCEHKVFAIITSHLGSLKKGWENFTGIINGSLEFDKLKGPTYQFLMGVPGQSLAIQTAQRVGVNSQIVEQAIKFLTPEHRQYIENLKEVERMKEELIKMRKELYQETQNSKKEAEKFNRLQSQLQTERQSIIERTIQDAESKIERLIERAKVEQTFKKHEELEKLKAEMPEIIKASSSTDSGQTFKISTPEEFTLRYPPGSKVFVKQLGQDAVIQGRPNAKGEVPILSNSMRLLLPWTEFKPPQKATNPTHEVLRKSQHYQISQSDEDRIVDLRGLSIEDAIQQLEIQLDTAALNSEDRVKVIHGHGTDALKRSVRSYLSRSVYVKKWKAGTPETGGDGITWIELS